MNAKGLYKNSAATLDDLREAVTLEERADRAASLGGAHPSQRELRETCGGAPGRYLLRRA